MTKGLLHLYTYMPAVWTLVAERYFSEQKPAIQVDSHGGIQGDWLREHQPESPARKIDRSSGKFARCRLA